MEQLIIAATISFGVGAFGYILYRFFLVPILHFRTLRKRILSAVSAYSGRVEQQQQDLRTLAAALSDCHDLELPAWYRLSLKKKDIHPLDAAADLQTLANTRQVDHIRRRVAAIRKALGDVQGPPEY
ncbi:MAG: hypothetical protein AB1547_13660 [Thermodesulfobacteriota bacterium]